MSTIFNYFQPKKIDSEGQLGAARSKTYTTEQEKQARAAGFNSADEMFAFMRARRDHPRGNTTTRGRVSLSDLLSWHPKNTLTRASDALASANER